MPVICQKQIRVILRKMSYPWQVQESEEGPFISTFTLYERQAPVITEPVSAGEGRWVVMVMLQRPGDHLLRNRLNGPIPAFSIFFISGGYLLCNFLINKMENVDLLEWKHCFLQPALPLRRKSILVFLSSELRRIN